MCDVGGCQTVCTRPQSKAMEIFEMAVKAKPDGYHTITPYAVLSDPEATIAFVEKVLDAKVCECMKSPDGKVMHAEAQIGDSKMMFGRAMGERKPIPMMLYIYGEDCDGRYNAALAAGAESIMPPQDMFYGDRHCGVRDSNGNEWWFATHIEDVSPEEMERRHEEYAAKMAE